MEELKLNKIEKLKEVYLSEPKNRIIRNSLNRNTIDDLCFVSENLKNTNFKFNLEVKTLPVCNQKQSGRCWIFAGLNLLREIIAAKLDIDNFELSQNYISMFDKLEKCNWALEVLISLKDREIDDRELKFILNEPINDGGQWDMFVSLINKYGVMPKDVFPETKQSEQTISSNRLLKTALRQFAAEIHNKDLTEISVIKEKYLSKIYNLIINIYGLHPSTFEFSHKDKNGKLVQMGEFDPVSFSNYFDLSSELNKYQSVVNAPTSDKKFNKTYTVKYLGNVVGGKLVNHLNVEMNRLEELIINQLKQNKVVWFGSDVSTYKERDLGIWDTKLFDYKSMFDIEFQTDKALSLDFNQSMMNHAMLITGVHLDEKGNTTRWKIENSWGDNLGKKGYFVMSEDFFKQYVYQAVIDKSLLNEKETDALNKEPEILKPWDPLGTLAE